MAEKLEVAQIMAMISSAYPNFSATKETIGVYYELLKDIPADLLKAASLQCCAEAGRKFAPSVGELRGAVSEIVRQTQSIPSVLEAWEETCKAKDRGISESHPLWIGGERYTTDPDAHKWSHPLVEQVARALGWPSFPKPDNIGVDRAHFFKQYESELTAFLNQGVQLPEVTRYIETNKSAMLSAGGQIKQLAKGMSNE